MAGNAERVVRCIQRRLHSVHSAYRSWRPETREVAELEARVHRLHAMSDRFTHVGLSPYVAWVAATDLPGRIGGERVATEV